MGCDAPPSSVCFSRGKPLDLSDRSELTDDEGVARRRAPEPEGERDREVLNLKRRVARQRKRIDELSSRLRKCDAQRKVVESERATLLDEVAGIAKEEVPSPKGWLRGSFQGSSAAGGGSMQMIVDANGRLMAENAQLQTLVDVTRKSFQVYVDETRRSEDEARRVMDALRRENERLRAENERLSRGRKLSVGDATATTMASSFSEPRLTTSPSSTFATEDRRPRRRTEGDDPHEAAAPNVDYFQSGKGLASFTQKDELKASLSSIPERELKQEFGTSGDDWIIEGEDIEASDDGGSRDDRWKSGPTATENLQRETAGAGSRAARSFAANLARLAKESKARSRSAEMLVNFEDVEERRAPRRATSAARLCSGNTVEVGPVNVTYLRGDGAAANRPVGGLGASWHSTQEGKLGGSLHSIPERRLSASSDDWIIEGEDIEAVGSSTWGQGRTAHPPGIHEPGKGPAAPRLSRNAAARCRSAEMLVDFGDTERAEAPEAPKMPRRASTAALSRSYTEGTSSRRSEELLVDFGRGRRGPARRWSSLRLSSMG